MKTEKTNTVLQLIETKKQFEKKGKFWMTIALLSLVVSMMGCFLFIAMRGREPSGFIYSLALSIAGVVSFIITINKSAAAGKEVDNIETKLNTFGVNFGVDPYFAFSNEEKAVTDKDILKVVSDSLTTLITNRIRIQECFKRLTEGKPLARLTLQETVDEAIARIDKKVAMLFDAGQVLETKEYLDYKQLYREAEIEFNKEPDILLAEIRTEN